MEPTRSQDGAGQGGGVPLAPWARRAITVGLLFHLAAVLTTPLDLATTSSAAARPATRGLRPYIQLFYLQHGYFFFAPNPGPSHLVRYELEFDDGRPGESAMFPDRRRHRPRLLYHRHFMLAEHLNSLFIPETPPSDLPPGELPEWRARRRDYERRWQGFERHLAATTGASRVRLSRIEHELLEPYEFFEQGRKLDDPALYVPLSETPPPEGPLGPLGPLPAPGAGPLAPLSPSLPGGPLRPAGPAGPTGPLAPGPAPVPPTPAVETVPPPPEETPAGPALEPAR